MEPCNGDFLHGCFNLSASHLYASQLQLSRYGGGMCCVMSDEYFVSFAPQHFRLWYLALVVQDMCSMYVCSKNEVSVAPAFC